MSVDQPELPLDLAPSKRKERAKPVTRMDRAIENAALVDGRFSPRLVLTARHLCMSRTGFTAAFLGEQSGASMAEAETFLRWAVRFAWCMEANLMDKPHPDRGKCFYVGKL